MRRLRFVLLLLSVGSLQVAAQENNQPQEKKQPPETSQPPETKRPEATKGSNAPAPCVILKEMGPADQVTSHLYSFGFRGKQFQYIEGNLPAGVPFHGRLTDHDVRKIMEKGGQVRVVQSKYTAEEVENARKSCSATGLNPK